MVCPSVWAPVSASWSMDVLVYFLLTRSLIPTILFLCVLELTCVLFIPIDVPVCISLVCRSLCVSSLSCSHSKYHCFSHFCLSLCVSKQLFLCQFVSLSLIMAIVLSLKFSPPHQFCLFVNSLYANSSQLFPYMVLLSVGLSLYMNHCVSFSLCLPSPLSDSISLYIHIYLSHHRCVSVSLT